SCVVRLVRRCKRPWTPRFCPLTPLTGSWSHFYGVRVSQGNQLLGRPLSHLSHPRCLKETGTLTALVAGSTT
ncbi:Serine hydroxymethyltransferase, partial [Dissostichus eleginoides]